MYSVTLVGLCVCLAVVGADSQEERHQEVGSSLTVTPDLSSVTTRISGLLWKHGSNKVLEWDGVDDTVDDYGQFKGRSTLNTTTAQMSLSDLTLRDSGTFSLEVDSASGTVSLTLLHLIVIAPVPKPTISTSCNDDMTSCTLTCDGDTADTGNITYSWLIDDTIAEGSPQVIIMKDDLSGLSYYQKYTCTMENPVSRERSDTKCNPFISRLDCTGTRMNMALVVFISLIAVVLVIVMVHRWRAGVWFYNTGYMPWEAEFWKKQGERDKTVEAADGDDSVTAGNEVKYKFTRRKENYEAEANGTSSVAEDRLPEGEGLIRVNEGAASAQ